MMKANAVAMVFVEVTDQGEFPETKTMAEVEADFVRRAEEALRDAFKGHPNARVIGAARVTKLIVEPR